jgi:hypothetical protein
MAERITVETLTIQLPNAEEWGEEEKQLAEQGLQPLVMFVNGPKMALLLAARPTDLQASLAGAIERLELLPAERMAFRGRVFEAVAFAIETQFKYLSNPSDLPNDAVILFCEALAHHGFIRVEDVGPCAVRFLKNDMENPDYEDAPDPDERDALPPSEET